MSNSEEKKGSRVNRRQFLGAMFGVSFLALAGQSGFMLKEFMTPVIEAGAFGSVVKAGRVEEFEVNSVNYFRNARFYLVRLEEGFLSMYRKCTHLGCVIPWDDGAGEFNCPCHSSLFTPVGEVISGPAPRPMDLFPVEVKDGEVFVDTGTIVERDAFSPDQVTPV